jgi:hypothetical protein
MGVAGYLGGSCGDAHSYDRYPRVDAGTIMRYPDAMQRAVMSLPLRRYKGRASAHMASTGLLPWKPRGSTEATIDEMQHGESRPC